MDKLKGKKVDRQALFGSGGDSALGADAEDVAMYESAMRAQLGAAKEVVAPRDSADAAASAAEEAPVFRLFAGAGPVKVTTEVAEPVFIAPKRPEAVLEESDSEEHWAALAAAAIDVQTVRELAAAPLHAMRYPGRVIHVKLAPASGGDSADSAKERVRRRQQLRRKRRQSRKAAGGAPAKREPYARVLSPYSGGVLHGEMLADVVRREEARAQRDAKRAAKHQPGGSSSGFRGRGRGRGRGAARF